MNPAKGLANIWNPGSGFGSPEFVLFLIVLAAVIYFNAAGIEVSDIVKQIATGLLGYWVARAENREEGDDADQ
jgi:hypothetical protein